MYTATSNSQLSSHDHWISGRVSQAGGKVGNGCQQQAEEARLLESHLQAATLCDFCGTSYLECYRVSHFISGA